MHRLIEMDWPEFGMGNRPPSATVEEMSARLDAARAAMSRAGVTHLMARCQARRTFMRDRLGFELADEILPLSNMTGLVPPFLLEPRCVLAT